MAIIIIIIIKQIFKKHIVCQPIGESQAGIYVQIYDLRRDPRMYHADVTRALCTVYMY